MAASIRWSISFPAPRSFHPSACKRRHGITGQPSISLSSTAAVASPNSSAAFSSQRSWENRSPPKPLPRQIPIRRPSAHRFPAGSFFGAFRTPAPYPASIAHARPASETLPVSGHSAVPCSERFKQTSSINVEPAAPGLIRPAPVMRASSGRVCGKIIPQPLNMAGEGRILAAIKGPPSAGT